MNRFVEEFSKFAGASHARQIKFADYLGDRGWALDLAAGEAAFGDDLKHGVQLLGLEVGPAWTWAWHKPDARFDANLFVSAKRVRDYGTQNSLKELTTGHYELTEFNGFVLAMFASGVCDDAYFYRAPTDEGAIYFLVQDIPADIDSKLPFEQVVPVIGHILSGFDVQHRIFVEAFLVDQGFSITAEGSQLHGRNCDGEQIAIRFDALDRIVELNQSSS